MNHYHTAEKARSRKILKAVKKVSVYLVLGLILAGMFVYRYGGQRFFPAPELLLSSFSELPVEVSPSGSFVVPFSQMMKAGTVEKAIRLTPELPHELSWDGNTLLINPVIPLQQGDVYQLVISERAQNIFGTPLLRPYRLEYRIGSDPHIVGWFPSEGQIESDEDIVLLFSHAMVGEDQLHKPFVPEHLELSPELEGEWKWHDSKTLVFSPVDGFPLSSEFHLIASGQLETRDAAVVSGEVDLHYRTESLALVGNNEDTSRDEQQLAVDEAFVLRFNQQVDMKSLEEHLEVLSSDAQAVERLRIEQSEEEPHSYLLMPSSGSWLYQQGYQLSLSEELMPLNGNLSLGESSKLSFSTEPFLYSEDAHLTDSGWYVSDNKLEFLLEEEVSIEELKEALYLNPEQSFNLSERGDGFRLSLPEFSQKRESITLHINDSISPQAKEYISGSISYRLEPFKDLLVDIRDQESQICFYANNPLSPQSKLSSSYDDREYRYDLSFAAKDCDEDDQLPYTAVVHKKHLVPDRQMTLSLAAVDLDGQEVEQSIDIRTDPVPAKDRFIYNSSQLFYQHVQKATDLSFSYLTQNIQRVNIQICKVEAEKAVQIETTYDERWLDFAPNESKCLRYKSIWKTFDSPWGEEDAHLVDIDSLLEEPGYGVYYVHVQAPSLTDERGMPLETNGVLQLSPWHILSKKGDSGLVWIVDRSDNLPVSRAIVNFYSQAGELLQAKKTNRDGVVFLPRTSLEYPFLIAKDNDYQVLINTFAQDGYEPWNYGVPFNVEEGRARYQFYLEEYGSDPSQINGAFILKDQESGRLIPTRSSEGVVVLVNAAEQILWREHRYFDDFGMLDFSIRPYFPLLDGNYQLNVCIGLHEGVCHGSNYWTNIAVGAQNQHVSPEEFEVPGAEEESLIRITDDAQGKVGKEIDIELQGLDAKYPALLTAERDKIFFQTVIIPDSESESISIRLEEEMVPELAITVSQFRDGDPIYDMQRLFVSRETKLLGSRQRSSDNKLTFFEDSGKIVEELSQISFAVSEPFTADEALIGSFYPRLGTSVITSANISPSISNSSALLPSLPGEKISDHIIVPGKLLSPDQESSESYQYILAHDDRGRFANVSIEPSPVQKVSTLVRAPSFLRRGDKVILDLDVINADHRNQNLKLSPAGDIFDSSLLNPLFLGVPANGIQTVSMPLQLKPGSYQPTAELSIQIDDREGSLIESQLSFDVLQSGHYPRQQNVMIHESDSAVASIRIPQLPPGDWDQDIWISATPKSFVSQTLRNFLGREVIGLEESIAKLVTALSYQTLVQTDKEDPELQTALKDLETELWFLRSQQRYDGGWTEHDTSLESDPVLTAWIARGLGTLKQLPAPVPDEMTADAAAYLKSILDDRANSRIREGIAIGDLDTAAMVEEMLILNGLSSLRPSGVGYSHLWYSDRDQLPLEAKVLLLLSLEDFRDAGVSGMSFKIENIVQELANERKTLFDRSRVSSSSLRSLGEQLWLESSAEGSSHFLLSSWYLEALVRQASSRSDLPALITWLTQQQYEQQHQSPRQQYSYLHAMRTYLQIFQTQLLANEIVVQVDKAAPKTFSLIEGKPLQAFHLQRELAVSLDGGTDTEIKVTAADGQPLFVETSWSQKLPKQKIANKGLSVYQNIEGLSELQVGDQVTGQICIISATELQDVVLFHPQAAGVGIEVVMGDDTQRVRTVGSHEKLYHFPVLPAGQTKIQFTWTMKHAGVFTAPQAVAQVREQPEIYGISNALELEIRPQD